MLYIFKKLKFKLNLCACLVLRIKNKINQFFDLKLKQTLIKNKHYIKYTLPSGV